MVQPWRRVRGGQLRCCLPRAPGRGDTQCGPATRVGGAAAASALPYGGGEAGNATATTHDRWARRWARPGWVVAVSINTDSLPSDSSRARACAFAGGVRQGDAARPGPVPPSPNDGALGVDGRLPRRAPGSLHHTPVLVRRLSRPTSPRRPLRAGELIHHCGGGRRLGDASGTFFFLRPANKRHHLSAARRGIRRPPPVPATDDSHRTQQPAQGFPATNQWRRPTPPAPSIHRGIEQSSASTQRLPMAPLSGGALAKQGPPAGIAKGTSARSWPPV